MAGDPIEKDRSAGRNATRLMLSYSTITFSEVHVALANYRENRERIGTDSEEGRDFVEETKVNSRQSGGNGWNHGRVRGVASIVSSAKAMCSIIAIAGKTSRISAATSGGDRCIP